MLACLQRYVGVTLVAASIAVLLVLPHQVPRRVRAGRALGFAAVSLIPLGLWLLRNQLVGHSLREDWPAPQAGLLENARTAWSSALFLAVREHATLSATGVLAIVVGAGTSGLLAARAVRRREPALIAYLAFASAYLVGLLAIASSVAMDPLNPRFLLPVVPLLAGVVVLGTREAWCVLSTRPAWLRGLACAPFLIAIGAYVDMAQGTSRVWVAEIRERGAGGLSGREWVESPLFAWLREHPLEGEVYSNLPELLLRAAGRRARLVDEASLEATLAEASEPAWLVWVDLPLRPGAESPRPELSTLTRRLTPVAELANGCVLRVEPGP